MDETKYKVTLFDRVKQAAYTKWREAGLPVDLEVSPLIHTETEDQITVDDSQINS